ncbi:MAG: hypothetical protein ACREXJ_16840, partial [Gammaproteobacteria bacterium]
STLRIPPFHGLGQDLHHLLLPSELTTRKSLSIFMNDSPRPEGGGRSVHPTGSSVRAKLHPGR